MKEQGLEVQIDRRSLKEQGLERIPQIHEGVTARILEKKGIHPESQVRIQQGFNGQEREIRYTEIDQNQTRCQHNAKIISLNIYNELPDNTQELRKLFDAKVEEHEKLIRERARVMAAKIEGEIKQQKELIAVHDREKPNPPQRFVVLRKASYKQRLSKWLKIAEELVDRYRRLLRRLARVVEYTKQSNKVYHYDRKAADIAEKLVRKEAPELALKLGKHQRIDREKIIKIERERQKQRKLEQGQDKGMSLSL